MALATEAPVHGAVPPPGPRRRKGRIVTLAIAGAGIGILAAAAFPLTGVLLQKYYLGKLDSDVLEERLTAARRLGELHAAGAVPDLLRIVAAPEVRRGAHGSPNTLVMHDPSDCFSEEDYGSPSHSPVFARLKGDSITWRGKPASLFTWTPEETASMTALLESLRVLRTALGKIGRQAIPGLNQVAADERASSWTRDLARSELIPIVRRLKRSGDGAALLEMVNDENLCMDFRIRIALELTAPSAARTTVPVLTKALDHADRALRSRAVRALGKAGGAARGAIPALEWAVLDRSRSITQEAVAALKAIRAAD